MPRITASLSITNSNAGSSALPARSRGRRGNQAHPGAIALDAEAISAVFDFVEPPGPCRHVGKQKSNFMAGIDIAPRNAYPGSRLTFDGAGTLRAVQWLLANPRRTEDGDATNAPRWGNLAGATFLSGLPQPATSTTPNSECSDRRGAVIRLLASRRARGPSSRHVAAKVANNRF